MFSLGTLIVKCFCMVQFEVEEIGSDEANVLKPEPKVEANAVETPLDNDFDQSLDEGQENNLKGDANATKDNKAMRVAVVKTFVPVGIEKPVVDGSVAQEPEPGTTDDPTRNIPIEVTNIEVEKEEHESSSQALNFKSIGKLEKLIHVRKVATLTINVIVMDKHAFDKDHNCVMAESRVEICLRTKLIFFRV